MKTILHKITPWRKISMHFQPAFYLKVLGTKETVLADQHAEKKGGKNQFNNSIINKLLLYQHHYNQWRPLKSTFRASLYC